MQFQKSGVVLLCLTVTGCASRFDLASQDPRAEGIARVGDRVIGIDFITIPNKSGVLGDVAFLQIDTELANELVREELKRFGQPGSRVAITIGNQPRIIGTIRARSGNQLELYNCVTRIPVPGPDGQKQCQTTHTPLLTLSVDQLTSFTLVEPPPSGYRVPELTDEITAVGLVFRDGHQEQWALVRTADTESDTESE